MNTPLLDEHLRTLRLPTMLANYKRVSAGDDAPITYLGELAAMEVGKRHENGVRARIAAAKFPVIKTLEAFDFAFQPKLAKIKLLELFDCTFVDQHRNIVLIGNTGVGKTHLLSALGVAACTRGYRVLFSTAAELLMSLITAKKEDRLRQRLASIDRYELLLIDELGYIPFEREATDLLFQVIARRYERKSLGITSNLAFPDWVQVFPDAMAASAIVDRLIHHGVVFELEGESHRLRSRKKVTSAARGT